MTTTAILRCGLFLMCAASITGCSSSSHWGTGRPDALPAMRDSSLGHFQTLHSFGSSSQDGADPWAPMLAVNGTLYGTTIGGGDSNQGTVFSMTPRGHVSILHSFAGSSDGAYPNAGLLDVNGVFYGTTNGNGSDYGTVYKIVPKVSEKTVYVFKGGRDGAYPTGGLVSAQGMLFGTTARGGSSGGGTVFSLSLNGEKRILHNFTPSEGDQPWGTLVAADGALFGTTTSGGKYESGTVFRVDTAKHFKVLHSFGGPGDGGGSVAGLLFVNGALYGTSEFGGGKKSNGTVFKLSLGGAERILHRFQDQWRGGYNVTGDLVSGDGSFHGTTAGTAGEGPPGTIFRVTPDGKFTTLHIFGFGEYPHAGLAYMNGAYYGTTSLGGDWGQGTAYVFRP